MVSEQNSRFAVAIPVRYQLIVQVLHRQPRRKRGISEAPCAATLHILKLAHYPTPIHHTIMRTPLEHESTVPWTGALPPRAWHKSNAARLLLNDQWRFRLSPTAAVSDQFSRPAFADNDWDTIPVPSHWVLQGDGKHGLPAYQNIKFPFPVDAPFVPNENPTGDYRYEFELNNWPQGGSVSTSVRVDSDSRPSCALTV